jgi:hypothetical protein
VRIVHTCCVGASGETQGVDDVRGGEVEGAGAVALSIEEGLIHNSV